MGYSGSLTFFFVSVFFFCDVFSDVFFFLMVF